MSNDPKYPAKHQQVLSPNTLPPPPLPHHVDVPPGGPVTPHGEEPPKAREEPPTEPPKPVHTFKPHVDESPKPDAPFKPERGDVLTLKSGGPSMTVTALSVPGEELSVTCQWFGPIDHQIYTEKFLNSSLVSAAPAAAAWGPVVK